MLKYSLNLKRVIILGVNLIIIKLFPLQFVQICFLDYTFLSRQSNFNIFDLDPFELQGFLLKILLDMLVATEGHQFKC
jgi:hypothetical protein